MCIRDAADPARPWTLDDFIKMSHQKMEESGNDGFSAEVDAAYKRCLKVLDKVDTEKNHQAVANAMNQ